ncbi:MAG TPA: hypothetical protein VGO67_10840 [Verrucomicrobiae bacterium]|jgi:hypothetical protein
MTAAGATEKQIECYRKMTGEQRLAIALELHEMSCEIAREGIRFQHPDADAKEVERLLRRRIEISLSILERKLLLKRLSSQEIPQKNT